MEIPHDVPLPVTGLAGFDADLSEEELGAQDAAHRFARDVMRPIGRELDKMTAEEVCAPGSPLWDFHGQIVKMGFGPEGLVGLPPAAAARFEGLIVQELAWGDAGLATSAGAGGVPHLLAATSGSQELIDLCAGKLGAWIATQPDRGSDGLNLYAAERPAGAKGNKGNLQARFVGDEIIINGQSSAWVSNGVVAQVGLLDIVADYGDGYWDKDGNTFGCNIIVPLDIKGVSKGKPLEKLGKRALPQGETFFDNVRVPKRFALATRDDYEFKHAQMWAHAGTNLNHLAVGLARAAFDLTLAYINERRQGGALLSELQLTQFRIGGVGMKVEAIKAMARHVAMYTKCSPMPHPYFTGAGKSYCNTEALNIVRECTTLFGGNGLTREYPIEKLLRDAQAQQIEDGENNLLQMHYGYLVSRLHRETQFGHA
jgi:acyl-CoA dehydrogenase